MSSTLPNVVNKTNKCCLQTLNCITTRHNKTMGTLKEAFPDVNSLRSVNIHVLFLSAVSGYLRQGLLPGNRATSSAWPMRRQRMSFTPPTPPSPRKSQPDSTSLPYHSPHPPCWPLLTTTLFTPRRDAQSANNKTEVPALETKRVWTEGIRQVGQGGRYRDTEAIVTGEATETEGKAVRQR